MRVATCLVLVAAVTSAALAGQNPDVRLYLDFDPPNGVTRIDPEPATFFDVYIAIDCFGPGGGARVVAVHFDRTFGGYNTGEHSFMGGFPAAGDIEDPYWGCAFAAGEDCVYPNEAGIVVVGYVRYYYTGPPGHITVQPTIGWGGAVVDCDYVEDDIWCVAGNAGVGADPPPPEPDCECDTQSPVHRATWSTLKALYR